MNFPKYAVVSELHKFDTRQEAVEHFEKGII